MKAKELLIAAHAWTEVRRITKMPFADQRGRVAGVTQQRRQRRVIGRKAENLVAFGDRASGSSAAPRRRYCQRPVINAKRVGEHTAEFA